MYIGNIGNKSYREGDRLDRYTNAVRAVIKSVCGRCAWTKCSQKEAEVRAIDAIVEQMDISSMDFTFRDEEDWQKTYNPVDTFKLYAYSYFNGIRSSRKIERECSRNIEVMWLINAVRTHNGAISCAEIAEKTELMKSTVSSIMAVLLKDKR